MFSLLYIDDEQGLLDLGQLFLESDGEFRVTTALSGEEGLRYLASQDFDAVVSDYQMPEMNGLELLKKVRKTYGNIPFILFTGRGREEVVIEAINNGVDFYLQKGGDPRSQFAELAHKVRQAVTRRRAEAALSDSEKRLADIINFLPDATFAIDKDGKVIAWNHAIEDMTGIPATEMLGKGDYEYALPFYNTRRPILIDLIFKPEEVIAKNYSHIIRQKNLLTADTTLPRPKGREVTLMGVAGPLYDRRGQLIGAIESIRDITERKRAEDALNESERRFRELADLLPQGIYEADTSGRLTYVNRIAREMFSYAPDIGIADINVMDMIAPVDRTRAATVYRQMVTTGSRERGNVEYLAVRRDGTTFPVSIFSSPVLHDGAISGVRGVIIDITERKQAEERLVAANREYTNLLDQIQDIYYFSDMDGKLVRASRSLATLLGFDDISECIGRSIADDFYLNPTDRKPLLDEIRRNGKVTGYEILLKKKDGTPVCVEVSSHLAYDPEGKVTGVEGTFHDITARKKAEEELRAAYEQLTANEEELKEQYSELAASEQRIRESEQKYRTVFETTGTAMLMIEDDTTISLVNSEFCHLSGYAREEIENRKKWMEFVVEEDRHRMLDRHRGRRADSGNALKTYEFRFLTRTGEIRDILLSIDMIPGTTRSVASLLDITERKKASDELQAINEQLVATDEELRAQYDELSSSEKLIRLSEVRLQYMLGFYEAAQKSEKDLLGSAIEGAGIITGSPLGYLAFLNDDESELAMYAWSKNAMDECSMVTKPIVYQVEKTGLWGEAIRQRRPVITNDYAAPNPAKKGYPEGHPQITRHMNVPVIDNGHIVLVAGVANKPADYLEHDVNELLLLMQGLWEILKRRRAEEAQKAADEQLRKSEEELHLLKISTDRSSDQIFWLDFAGNILYVNDAACREYGYSREEFSRMKIYELNPDVTEEIWKLSVDDLRQRKTQFITTRHHRRDGTVMDVEIIAVYVSQDDREYSFAYVRDITARRKTENDLKAAYEQLTASGEELREQYDTLAAAEAEISSRREQLEEIASTVPGVVYQFYARPDGSRGMYYISNRSREVLGLEPDLETFFPAFTAGVHPDDRARFAASIDDAIQLKGDWHFEGRFIRGSGGSIWFEGRSTPVAHGSELVFSGVLLDITSRKNMEAAILESEEKYRSLVDLSPVAVIVHRDGKILYANPEALRLAGAGREEEVVGQDILPFIHPDDRAMAMDDFRLLSGEGRTIPLKEERLVRIDGTPFTVEITAMPIRYHGTPAFLAVFRDITRRKQAETALAESERKYRTVFETAEEGIWIVDTGFRTVSANRKMQELFGYTEEEMAGRPVWDFVPPDNTESMKQELAGRPKGIPGRYEREWVRKDGTVIWCLTSATPLFSPSGEFLGSFGMFTDITERKQTDDALRASEKKYRLLVENIPFGITLIDADHRIVMSNAAQGQMFNTDAGLWPGRYCYREFEKRDAVCAHCPGTKAMATGVCHVAETEGVRDDGTRFNARIHAIPLPDDEGKATRFIEVVEDITERKKAEDALRRNEEKYRTLIETTGTGFVIIGRDGCVLDANPEYVRLTGHTRLEEIMGRNVIEWTAEDERERNAEAVRQCLRDGFIRNFEINYTGRDGTVIPIEINATVLRSDGSVHILTLCRDISDRRQIQDALKTGAEDYQTILQTAMDGFCIIAMDGSFIDINEAFCRLLGYSREEALALTLRDVEVRETAEDTSRHIGNILKKGYDRFETQWQRKDRGIIDVEVSVLYTTTHGGRFITFSRDITERRNAEKALRENEARLASIFRAAPTGIGLVVNRVIMKVNDRLCEMTGYSAEGLLGKNARILYPSDEDYEFVGREKLGQIQKYGTGSVETRWQRRDGPIIDILLSTTPLDPADQGKGVTFTALDITSRRQTENALRESEAKLRAVIDQSFQLIGLMTPDGILIDVNRAALELVGTSRAEALNRPFWETPWWSHSEELQEKLKDAVRRAASGETVRFEATHPAADGHLAYIDFSVKPVVNPDGRILYLIPEGRDITGRKQAEDELVRLKISTDLSSDEVFWMDFAGNILYVNDAACRITGYSREEFLKMKIFELDPDFPPEVWGASVADLRERKTQFFTTRHRRKDGSIMDVEIVTVYVNQDNREYSFAYVRDVTGRKQMENALRESEEKYRTLVESSFDGIAIHQDGKIVYVNQTAARLLGYDDPGQIIGSTAIDIVAPAYREMIARRIQESPEKPMELIREQFLRADGTPIDVDVTTIPTSWEGRPATYVTFRDITAQKRAEESLRESEEKYRTLVEQSQDGVFIVQDDRLVFYNRTFAEMTGYDEQELIGHLVAELILPEDRDRVMARHRQRVSGGTAPVSYEFSVIHKDGSTPLLVRMHAGMASYKGRPATIGTFRNITEDRKQEDAIRESEEKYRTLVEINRDIIFSLDTDGTIRYVSPQTEPLLGYRPDEMEGNVFTLFIHPDDSGQLVRHIHDSLATGEPPRRDQFRIRRKDGTYRWFEDNTRYTTDGRGRPVLAGTIRDIADEKAAQDALRESEEKYRTLVETTSDFIWEVDADGKYTYVSPQVSRILGYEPGELIGKTPFDLMPPDEAARISAEFSHLAHSRLPISALENKIIRKDGSVVILETSGVVRSSVDGGFLGYHGIDRDITDRKLAEEALREKTEEFNRFFTASLDLFCIADTEGYFRRLNPEWEKTLGYTLDELEGHRFLDFVHPDDLASTLSAVADLKEQKNVINFTNRYRHKDGTYRWIEWRSLPMGSLIFAAARDITARHDAADRTARISALKQDLLRTAPLGEKLERITDAIVDIFGADFARIWISGPGDLCGRGCIHAGVTKGPRKCRDRSKCLHLVVSSGRYTNTDGSYRRVPFGASKIGRIATGKDAMFITNDATHDPLVRDHAWASSLGLASFAGFRLISAEGEPVGVLAFFSRLPVLPEIMDDLADMATTASQVIQTGMAEQALRESEARLGSILHGSPVLQFAIGRNHRVISWNSALEEYSGIREADIIGTDLQWRAFYPEKRPLLADLLVDGNTEAIDEWYAAKFRKSRYVEGAYEATDFFPHMGGSGKWLSFTAAPIRDVQGEIIGAVETLEDVTERIEAEKALRQSEEWARTILNMAQAGIVIIDAETHRILDANNKALELIGLPAKSVIGSICHRFICPAEEGRCPVTDLGMTVDTSERILVAADGTRIPVLKTVVPLTMGDRKILVESFVDITEHKRSESAIREVNRKLNLLSSITRHDVANQLTVVHGYAQLAEMKEPDPVVRDFLKKIVSAVETIQRQIAFTKEYQELGVHAPAWFNAGQIIRDARPKKVRLRCSCDEYEVFADPMIGRVFYNLFDNTVKYGGHVTTVTAGCKKQGDGLVITFADNGVGIPPDEKKKIFEKGFGKHTGFGLFLAREILAITGITIHETGVEGRGARFEIVVPKGAFRQKP